MTTADTKTPKHGLLSIYKPGQGKIVRWGTVAGLAMVAGSGAFWLVNSELAVKGILAQSIGATLWLLLWAFAAFYMVNSPKMAEFLIMTESEMRKVTWPSRRETISSTKVVIFLTLLLGVMLWLVDLGFVQLFQKMGIN